MGKEKTYKRMNATRDHMHTTFKRVEQETPGRSGFEKKLKSFKSKPKRPICLEVIYM